MGVLDVLKNFNDFPPSEKAKIDPILLLNDAQSYLKGAQRVDLIKLMCNIADGEPITLINRFNPFITQEKRNQIFYYAMNLHLDILPRQKTCDKT